MNSTSTLPKKETTFTAKDIQKAVQLLENEPVVVLEKILMTPKYYKFLKKDLPKRKYTTIYGVLIEIDENLRKPFAFVYKQPTSSCPFCGVHIPIDKRNLDAMERHIRAEHTYLP